MINVVLGILVNDSRVLIQERPITKPYAGYWEFPGGKIEPNEKGLVALKREWKEELNLDVHDAAFIFHHEHTYPDRTVKMEVWHVLRTHGQPEPQEGQRLMWAEMHELDQLQVLSGNAKVIEWVKSKLS